MSTVSHSNLLVEEVRIDGYSQPVVVRTFRPGRRERRLAIVLYFHGGLFTAGTLDDTAAACGTLALQAHAWVLSRRIATEEAVLFRNPDYRARMHQITGRHARETTLEVRHRSSS